MLDGYALIIKQSEVKCLPYENGRMDDEHSSKFSDMQRSHNFTKTNCENKTLNINDNTT